MGISVFFGLVLLQIFFPHCVEHSDDLVDCFLIPVEGIFQIVYFSLFLLFSTQVLHFRPHEFYPLIPELFDFSVDNVIHRKCGQPCGTVTNFLCITVV
jgi:hypothetical protein